MKSHFVVRAAEFIERFIPFWEDCDSVESAVEGYNIFYNQRATIYHGTTRYALLNSDFAIKWDYGNNFLIDTFGGCQNEVNVYREAKVYGYEYLFAEIIPLKIHGYQFYVMPRIDNVGMYDDIENYLTEDENDFICDMGIQDLHSANWGIKNNRPVIIDYACV